MPDPRQVVGGEVWAKAAAVSRDFKRILGNQFEKTWIRGEVLRVEKRKASDAAKRATTYIVAKYPCEVQDGVQQYKEKEIPLQTLKEKNPNDIPQVEDPPPEARPPSPPAQDVVPTEAGEAPGTVATQMTAESNGTRATSTTTASTSTTSTRLPVTESNGRQWFEGNTDIEVNGKPASKFWKLTDQYGRGHEFYPGCDQGKNKFRALDYFLALFPRRQLQLMNELTSSALEEENLQPTTIGELLKFLGVMLIITRFEFGKRSSLWATTARTRFVPAPNLGHTTGMSRERFDHLWRFIVWSEQPKERPAEMSHEEWRWSLVQDFVDNFNEHRETFYQASSLICADESISRWYGLGGNWINCGLPHYVAMDRKPEFGCEIQNACDGISGIMMRLKLVKSQAAEAATNEEQRLSAAAEESR